MRPCTCIPCTQPRRRPHRTRDRSAPCLVPSWPARHRFGSSRPGGQNLRTRPTGGMLPPPRRASSRTAPLFPAVRPESAMFLLTLLLACNGGAEDTGADASGTTGETDYTYYADIKPIVDTPLRALPQRGRTGRRRLHRPGRGERLRGSDARPDRVGAHAATGGPIPPARTTTEAISCSWTTKSGPCSRPGSAGASPWATKRTTRVWSPSSASWPHPTSRPSSRTRTRRPTTARRQRRQRVHLLRARSRPLQ